MVWYPNGEAPADALWAYRGSVGKPEIVKAVSWTEIEYMRRNPDGYIRPNEIYRNFAGQVYWREWWTDRGKPGNAAVPGNSNHGDWNVGAVDWDADNIELRDEVAAAVGLHRNVPGESWHYAKLDDGWVDLSDFDPTRKPAPPAPPPEKKRIRKMPIIAAQTEAGHENTGLAVILLDNGYYEALTPQEYGIWRAKEGVIEWACTYWDFALVLRSWDRARYEQVAGVVRKQDDIMAELLKQKQQKLAEAQDEGRIK